MTRKYNNHRLQAKIRHREEATENTDSLKTIKVKHQLSHSQEMIAKPEKRQEPLHSIRTQQNKLHTLWRKQVSCC